MLDSSQLAWQGPMVSRYVMDFENPPPPPDDCTSDVRQAFGIQDDELFILQPTRVVARKGVEMAIHCHKSSAIRQRRPKIVTVTDKLRQHLIREDWSSGAGHNITY